MSEEYTTRVVTCPRCGNAEAFARIPSDASVTDEGPADESAQTTCMACGATFPTYYLLGE